MFCQSNIILNRFVQGIYNLAESQNSMQYALSIHRRIGSTNESCWEMIAIDIFKYWQVFGARYCLYINLYTMHARKNQTHIHNRGVARLDKNMRTAGNEILSRGVRTGVHLPLLRNCTKWISALCDLLPIFKPNTGVQCHALC